MSIFHNKEYIYLAQKKKRKKKKKVQNLYYGDSIKLEQIDFYIKYK